MIRKVKKTAEAAKPMDPVLYEVVRRPVVTEKSTQLSEQHKIVFRVARNADKGAIKTAVEKLFNVKVAAINTLRADGKTRRFKGVMGKKPAFKKAIVTLAEGQSVDIMAGV